MFCQNCGKKRELKNRFCTSCGTQLEENIRQENSEQIQESVKTTSKKSISLKLNKKVLAIIAVLVIGGFFVFKGMSGNANSPEGVVQTFLTAIDEVDMEKIVSLMYTEEGDREEMIRNIDTENLKKIKEDIIYKVGVDFAQPDNIEVRNSYDNEFPTYFDYDDYDDEFQVYVDYTTSYIRGLSDYKEMGVLVFLKDGKYYVEDYYTEY